MGQGTSSNIYPGESGHPLCVVRLFNPIRAAKPNCFSEHNAGSHLFTLSDGNVLHRGKVESTLRKAANQLKLLMPISSPHSLRAGGATATWAAGSTVEEEIQRRGRWASQCFRLYLWESRSKVKEVGSRMLSATVSMFSTMASVVNQTLRCSTVATRVA